MRRGKHVRWRTSAAVSSASTTCNKKKERKKRKKGEKENLRGQKKKGIATSCLGHKKRKVRTSASHKAPQDTSRAHTPRLSNTTLVVNTTTQRPTRIAHKKKIAFVLQ